MVIFYGGQIADKVQFVIAGCGVNALSGLRMAQESVGLISVAHQAFATTAGCGVDALSALHVQFRNLDKTRQASHPAFPMGVLFLNPITNPTLPFSLFSGDG